VTAALAVGRFWGKEHRQGAAEGGATAEDDDLPAGDGHAVVRQKRFDARRSARQWTGQADSEAAQVEWVHAVYVLVRVDRLQRHVVVQMRRDGVLDEQPMHGRVRVEAGNDPVQFGLADGGGKVLMRGGEPEGGSLALLDANVTSAGVIVTDENSGQARCYSAAAQTGGCGGGLGQDGLGDGRAGQEAGRTSSGVGGLGGPGHVGLLGAGAQAVDPRDRLPDGSTIPVPPVAVDPMMPYSERLVT
jgi:hypothetical protein